jgi:cytochrome b561
MHGAFRYLCRHCKLRINSQEPKMSAEVTRYHPALVVLHWLLALAIVLAFVFGAFVLDDMDNSSAQKPGLLKLHIVLGGLILVFTLVRLAVRASSSKPAPLQSGKPAMDKLAVAIHHLLYTLTVLTTLGGVALAYSADLFHVLFQHVGSLPKDFEGYASHEIHGLLALALLGVAGLHVAGALQHQFILKDGILSRMSLRGKTSN